MIYTWGIDFFADDWSDLPVYTAGDTIDGAGHTFTATLTIDTHGTVGAPITFRNFISEPVSGRSITINARNYIHLEDIVSNNSGGLSAIFNFCSNIPGNSPTGMRVSRVTVNDPAGHGIATGQLFGGTIQEGSDIVVSDVIVNRSGGAAVLIAGVINGCLVQRVRGDVVNLGLGNTWGIYGSPGGNTVNSGWVLDEPPTDAYRQSITAIGLDAGTLVKDVWWTDGDGSGSPTDPPHLLTKRGGDQSNVSFGEWGQVGDDVYINVGTDPNGTGVHVSPGRISNMTIDDSEASNVVFAGGGQDGVGIGYDRGCFDSTVSRCFSHDNKDGYNISLGDNIRLINNRSLDQDRWGFVSTAPGPNGHNYYNNVSRNPGLNLGAADVFRSNFYGVNSGALLSYYNNATVGGTFGWTGDGETSISAATEDTNAVQDATVSPGFANNVITGDLGLNQDNDYSQAGGLTYDAGLFVAGVHDTELDQNKLAFRAPIDIGLQSNVLATPQAVVATDTVLIPIDLFSNQTLGEPDVVELSSIEVLELTQAQTLDDTVVTEAQTTSVESLTQAQSFEKPQIFEDTDLGVIDSLTQAQTLGESDVVELGIFEPLDLSQGQTLGLSSVSEFQILDIDSLLQAQTLGRPAVSDTTLPRLTPPSRRIKVAGGLRKIEVGA